TTIKNTRRLIWFNRRASGLAWSSASRENSLINETGAGYKT
ncbi:MAG: hypothetical protein ACI85U_003765, partial [Candidatus Promineifilaceae bacterium]